MNLDLYFTPILKWWKLIMIAALIAGISTAITILSQPSVYETRTTLMIGQSITSPNPSSTQFYLEQDLARIYADMGRREPVRRAAMEALGMNFLPAYTIMALPNSQLIEIMVRDTNPIRSQAVAAELANQLIKQTPTEDDPAFQERESFIKAQLGLLQEDIEFTEVQLQALEIQFGDLQGAREIAEVERQIGALENKLVLLQGTYASLIASSQQGAVNTLTIIEPAEIPARTANPSPVLTIFLAMALGAGIATGGAYLLELFDRRANTPQDVYRMLDWPTLAEIEVMVDDADTANYIAIFPQSSIANSIRAARTSLELAGVGKDIRTLLVTGPAASDGKSTIAQNLAISFAMGKRKVVLVQADFYGKSHVSHSGRGLSDLLIEGGPVDTVLLSTDEETMSIMPAGENTEDAINLLNTKQLNDIFCSLNKQFDVVIVDAPPTFVSDTMLLAASSEGVLVVIRMTRTPIDAIKRMVEKFDSFEIRPVGMILNGVSRTPIYYQGYYSQQAMPAWQAILIHSWRDFVERMKKSRIGKLGRRIYPDQNRSSDE
jgi:capsular exopolysaccharide synthesis family protein